MSGGRPLRFLGATVFCWTTIRIALLLPGDPTLAGLAHAVVPPLAAAVLPPRPPAAIPARSAPQVASRSPVPQAGRVPASALRSGHGGDPVGLALALAGLISYGEPIAADPPTVPPPQPPVPLGRGRPRLAGSAWAIVRGGSAGSPLSGQLGASQAGVRLTYALGEARRVAIAARVATPLRGRGREAAIGIDWQPTRLPVHLVVEQRLALDGGHGGPAAMAIAGLNPTPVGAGFRLEAYGQAGAVKRATLDGFADGAARLARPVVSVAGITLDAGAGAWGSVQRGAARLDVGPSLGARVPVAGRRLRLTLDWRQRIAGDARPGSGPALSLGTDF